MARGRGFRVRWEVLLALGLGLYAGASSDPTKEVSREERKQRLLSEPVFQNNRDEEQRVAKGAMPPQRVDRARIPTSVKEPAAVAPSIPAPLLPTVAANRHGPAPASAPSSQAAAEQALPRSKVVWPILLFIFLLGSSIFGVFLGRRKPQKKP